MSISPFSAWPASPDGDQRRARLVLLIATIGIAATLLAYAISPGVRHVVGHAAHSVGHVLDHDKSAHKPASSSSAAPAKTPSATPAKTSSAAPTVSAPGQG